MALKCGIVGLPNVGKSTLFNCLSSAKAQAANFPFCTIEPNLGVITVPDERLNKLAEIVHPGRIVPATCEIVDIAGLVKGASKGEGLGNKFLGNIRECDAIIHVIRCFEDNNIVREGGAASPIENLAAGQNLTAMDDIKYIQNKIVTALRVPKSFLNFEDAAGDGKNLSLLDVRFMRTVNRIQKALLLELNKIATIHLLMLGFTDDLTNFTLEMVNPSSQAEMLDLENLAKKVTTAKDAVTDPGGGMPLTSMTWAWRHIFKWSDKEIQQNLEELRLIAFRYRATEEGTTTVAQNQVISNKTLELKYLHLVETSPLPTVARLILTLVEKLRT